MDMDVDKTGSNSPTAITTTKGDEEEQQQQQQQHPNDEPHIIRSRVANACDGCKARKVKCDGKLPCSYCTRRQRPHTCKYSPPRQRRHPRSRNQPPSTPSVHSPQHSVHGGNGNNNNNTSNTEHRRSQSQLTPHPTDHERNPSSASITAAAAATAPNLQHTVSDPNPLKANTPGTDPFSQQSHRRSSDAAATVLPEDHEEAEVPREARLLCDAQGKLIFIGDCAPLSFFQTVRQLVTSRVDQNAFAPQTSRYSVLENAVRKSSFTSGLSSPPEVVVADIPKTINAYLSVTSGMVDLFVSRARLLDDITIWASNNMASHRVDDVSSAVNYLVLALGTQQRDEDLAQLYFEYARDQALATLNGNLSIETAQAFILVTLYMLCACQINGAFLFFGLAVRAAYSIGIHRTEVNSRFGPETHRQRDRLWKSLRIVDLFLSTSMGRPPCTSDVDCTVPYRQVDDDGHEIFDILNASVQIFLILEGIVLEVYSRRKISFQLTEGISRQLRDFSVRWLHQMKRTVSCPTEDNAAEVNGACQVLASYYYAVMLVSRPFLMYELYRRLSPEPTTVYGRAGLVSGKSKLADACIDAASMMVDQVLDLVDKGTVSGRRPILVSWLFAGSLVLGAGLLGSFGRILEKYARMSMTALEHFAKLDAHAAQYAMISKSLLMTAVEYLEKKEAQERLQRTESSAQLFGLLPSGMRGGDSLPSESSNYNNGYHRRSPEFARKMMASPQKSGGGGGMGNGSGVVEKRESSSAAPGGNSGEQHQNNNNNNHHHHQQNNGGGDSSHQGTTASSSGMGTAGFTPGMMGMGSPLFSDLDPAFLTMSNSLPRTPDLSLMNSMFEGDEANFGGLNLFPLLDGTGGGGHIDLAHYL